MNTISFDNRDTQKAFDAFVRKEHLNEQQAAQFKQYATLLLERNEQFNLTSITDIHDILSYHFQDSLRIGDVIDFNTVSMIADVGSGGGFPGIPLKIRYPHLSVMLIEVNLKKVDFLQEVIDQLHLSAIEISALDWRTFLRTTHYPIAYFFARASLHTDELVRIFKPGCFYKDASLVYWASQHWKITDKEAPFMQKEVPYEIEERKRKFVFFKRKEPKIV